MAKTLETEYIWTICSFKRFIQNIDSFKNDQYYSPNPP